MRRRSSPRVADPPTRVTTCDEWTAAFRRLAGAISRREPLSIALVFDLSARIDRYAPNPRGGSLRPPAETFVGLAEITRWLLRTPSGTTFDVVGDAEMAGDGTARIEYAVSVGAFRNGGVWRARMSAHTRFDWWAHHPFTLVDG